MFLHTFKLYNYTQNVFIVKNQLFTLCYLYWAMEKRLIKYNRLKSVLSDKGKTNEDLAEFLGMHANSVTKWNSNKTQPSIPVLYRIAEFLEVRVYDLLEETPKVIQPVKRRTNKKG